MLKKNKSKRSVETRLLQFKFECVRKLLSLCKFYSEATPIMQENMNEMVI